MSYFTYILISTICLSFSYGIFIVLFRKETRFHQSRFFLMASIFISMLMPLNRYKIDIRLSEPHRAVQTEIQQKLVPQQQEVISSNTLEARKENHSLASASRLGRVNMWGVLQIIYFSIGIILVIRILLQIMIIVACYLKSKKIKIDNQIIIYNSRFKNTFSFFHWIFINKELEDEENLDQIISHEKVHASQYHSFDLIVIELLAAAMWFNPIIWKMRNTLQLVHEYLADEGALNTGIDRLRYQALLLNQIIEEKLIGLSSNFNHSLIKKRMIMMTKNKINQKTRLRILVLVPLILFIFLGVACMKGQNSPQIITAIAPTKMNVLYLGVDNPIAIAASGVETTDLEVTMENGIIEGRDGQYIARPFRPGPATIKVNYKGKEIQQSEFRVKLVPDPVAAIPFKKGISIYYKTQGEISKKDLLDADSIVVIMQNFDFDLKFDILEFTVSTRPNGYIKEAPSNSNKFTEGQKQLIKELKPGHLIYFQYIKCKGPDGSERNLSPMILTVIE
jgi:hypothetical protein